MTEHGAVIVDGKQTGTTLSCPHCGMHFLSFPGSGKRRMWCGKCAAVTCGQHKCDICAPIEARLDFAEGKRTTYDEAIIASGFIL